MSRRKGNIAVYAPDGRLVYAFYLGGQVFEEWMFAKDLAKGRANYEVMLASAPGQAANRR